MDIIDAANDLTELNISHAIQNRTPPLTSINGMCRWCETELATHGAFCSRECGEDYERDRRKNEN
ncbi:hypothetical protein ID858_10505 [Xenorhabdus sp. DI]|uniref:hypothetical protein n=1 Tax=Xenorhabdus doucetiae TaxID=351671 RepID=UPI0019C1469E|nr:MULTISPECIES: hypothetical protein [unclassified Xenorhabdus]MBD2784712.1 hypothetical protein [Xenorhabdus sp. 3]MBD2788936.1 hypothetical protein [Xenorhabdus sp. DI]